jgi:lipid-binding SYLF domain-containing protein
MATQEDAESMAYVLNRAKGVAIFPSVVKAGLVIGGQYGEGLLLKRDSGSNWYGPSFVNIAGASWGLQIGAQSVALVLVITNDRGMEQFMKGDQFKLGGDIAIAAGPVGRQGSAATDINLKASIYSYSMSKGLFAGITLEGSEVEVDENANTVYWGTATSPEKALSRKASSSKIKQLTGEIEKLMRLSR